MKMFLISWIKSEEKFLGVPETANSIILNIEDQIKALRQLSKNMPVDFANQKGTNLDIRDPSKPEFQIPRYEDTTDSQTIWLGDYYSNNVNELGSSAGNIDLSNVSIYLHISLLYLESILIYKCLYPASHISFILSYCR